jgi:hypothetical protein
VEGHASTQDSPLTWATWYVRLGPKKQRVKQQQQQIQKAMRSGTDDDATRPTRNPQALSRAKSQGAGATERTRGGYRGQTHRPRDDDLIKSYIEIQNPNQNAECRSMEIISTAQSALCAQGLGPLPMLSFDARQEADATAGTREQTNGERRGFDTGMSAWGWGRYANTHHRWLFGCRYVFLHHLDGHLDSGIVFSFSSFLSLFFLLQNQTWK